MISTVGILISGIRCFVLIKMSKIRIEFFVEQYKYIFARINALFVYVYVCLFL